MARQDRLGRAAKVRVSRLSCQATCSARSSPGCPYHSDHAKQIHHRLVEVNQRHGGGFLMGILEAYSHACVIGYETYGELSD